MHGYGSYYESDYYRNPVPYTTSDIGEPVPGWGVNLDVAGPARLGVGAESIIGPGFMTKLKEIQEMKRRQAEARERKKAEKWWLIPVIGAGALVVVGVVGYKKGWF